MAQAGNNSVRNNEDRFSGEYMVQDHDHLSQAGQGSRTAPRSGGRQPEQSQSRGRQQGGSDDHVSGQQGGERHRKSR
jgi:hypothetical protein